MPRRHLKCKKCASATQLRIRSRPLAPSSSKRLIFIAGTAGSGTTLLLRLLSSPPKCASLGGNFIKAPHHPDARKLMSRFTNATTRLWDRAVSHHDHDLAKHEWRGAFGEIVNSPHFADYDCLIFKRSYPFSIPYGQYVPDLSDVLELSTDVRIVAVYREPCAATYSALRRKFDSDLRKLAVICDEQLEIICKQVGAADPARVMTIRYSDLHKHPPRVLQSLATFCDISFDELARGASSEKIYATADSRWMAELSKEHSDWLVQYFDPSRVSKWSVLLGEG